MENTHGDAHSEGGAFQFRGNRLFRGRPCRPQPGDCWRYSGPAEEWVDTEISFRLEWRDGQTIVLFRHADWREPVEFMHHCSTKWATFLLSLKDYVEHGEGRPRIPATPRSPSMPWTSRGRGGPTGFHTYRTPPDRPRPPRFTAPQTASTDEGVSQLCSRSQSN